jgi:Ca2+-binding EF-hand superfamily protein
LHFHTGKLPVPQGIHPEADKSGKIRHFSSRNLEIRHRLREKRRHGECCLSLVIHHKPGRVPKESAMRYLPLILACASSAVLTLAAQETPPGGEQRRGPGHKAGPPINEALRKHLLEKYDTNKDGKLSEEERSAAQKDFKENGAENRAKLFALLDVNKDQAVDEKEWMAGRATIIEFLREHRPDGKKGEGRTPPTPEEKEKRRKEMEAKRLAEFDTDKDGKLSDEERAKMRETLKERHKKNMDERLDHLFDRIDANDDNKLERDEFMKPHPGEGDGQRPPGDKGGDKGEDSGNGSKGGKGPGTGKI